MTVQTNHWTGRLHHARVESNSMFGENKTEIAFIVFRVVRPVHVVALIFERLSSLLVYLMQGCQTVDIGSVDVCPPGDEVLHLLLIPSSTGSQEHAAITEANPPLLPFKITWLPESLTVLPSLQLLRSFHKSRVGSCL